MTILLREGFRYHRYVDIFDAGPTLEAVRNQIRTFAASHLLTIQNISDELDNNQRFQAP